MPEITINFMAVLAAGVASMVVGFLWYSPVLFGNAWMKLIGYTAKSTEAAKKEMGKTYALSFVGALVMAYVLSHFVKYVGANTMNLALQTAFWGWVGFVAPVQATDALFGGKSWKLFGINTGYQLASLLVMAAVLSMMP